MRWRELLKNSGVDDAARRGRRRRCLCVAGESFELVRVCEQGDATRHEQEAADREEEKADQYQCPAEDEGVAAHALRSGRGDVH